MKVLITGSNGMLGYDVLKVFSDTHKVIPMTKKDLDITDITSTMDCISSINPDLVINTAAMTKVDECETDLDSAYKVNGYGAGNIAVACEEIGARLIHISTDYVFDGEKRSPYLEDDTPNPLNIYGKSKLLGEENVKKFCKRHYIVRTQWLFGKNGGNFVETILRLAKSGKPLSIVNDQLGSPTYTLDLAEALLKLAESREYGTYHITNSGIASWYEFAVEIIKYSGLQGIEITPCTTAEFPRPARRPAHSVLKNFHWDLTGKHKLRDYNDALNNYIN